MYNLNVISQVIVIFIMMLAGIYSRRMKIITSEASKVLSALLLNITLPLNIIASFNISFSLEMLKGIGIMFLFGILVHPLSYVIGKVIFSNINENRRKVLIFLVTFSNCGFMGYPILEAQYGKTGILYGAVFIGTFNLFLWTIGMRIFNDKDHNKAEANNIFNPGIISVILGLILFVFSIRLPYPLQKSFELIGNMTTPLSMIITGAVLAEAKSIRFFQTPSIYAGSFIRLLIIPATVYLICSVFKIDTTIRGACTIIAGMPAATMTTVFAERFNGNSNFASQAVFICTILSIITIPLLVLII